MNAHTTIIAPIYRDRPADLEPDVAAAMDRVAKADMAAARRAGNITPSMRADFTSLADRGAQGGKSRQGRPRATDEHDIMAVLRAIDNGHTNAHVIAPQVDRNPVTVLARARKMAAIGLLGFTGPANGLRTFHITEAGRAWMEARA